MSMSIAWINPAALIALGLVALPIAVHLLVRQPARRIAFPSLRFLRETQLAAFRRRTIQDAPLLLCRVAIVTAAAFAVAGPVWQTPSRTAGYANRVSRAIVVAGSAGDESLKTLGAGAWQSSTFRRAAIGDAVADAVRWLDRQPPSAREMVFAGELGRGAIEAGDLLDVPASIGIRFAPAAISRTADVTMSFLVRRDGVLMRVNRPVRLSSDATTVSEAPGTPVTSDLMTIAAGAANQPLADAALRTALDAGVTWTDFDRHTLVVWEGADESVVTRAPAGTLIVRMPVPAPPSASADAVLAALARAAGVSRAAIEPIQISPEQLSEWSRVPGPPRMDGRPTDEGDRRWLWGAALVLLGLEWWLRTRSGQTATAIDEEAEARVA